MKNISYIKKIYLLIISSFSLACCAEMTGYEIMSLNKYSIVELKATFQNNECYGTAVIVDESGLLITNSHILEQSDSLTGTYGVRFVDEDSYSEVEVVKKDYDMDLAVLKFKNTEHTYTPIEYSKESYNFGDTVYAIGNSSNYGIGISKGIISVPEVSISINGTKRSMIQADVTVANGNSGGALVNDKGKLIGLVTFRTKDSYGNINYGFVYCIPISQINSFLCD